MCINGVTEQKNVLTKDSVSFSGNDDKNSDSKNSKFKKAAISIGSVAALAVTAFAIFRKGKPNTKTVNDAKDEVLKNMNNKTAKESDEVDIEDLKCKIEEMNTRLEKIKDEN